MISICKKMLFNKKIIFGIILFLFINLVFVYGAANPSAVYCEELGYKYEVVHTKDGDYGKCIINGKEFDGWDFLRGKVGKEYSYCAEKGYNIITEIKKEKGYTLEYAVCVSKNKKIKMEELMKKDGKFLLRESSIKVPSNVKESSVKAVQTLDLPSSFDWRNYNNEDWMTSVKDQGSCNSCGAFSAIGVIEAKYNIYNGNPNLNLDLSEQEIMSDCAGYNCDAGVWPDDVLDYTINDGIVDEDCFPYVDGDSSCNRCVDYEKKERKIVNKFGALGDYTHNNFKINLVNNGPLSVLICADSNFRSYGWGIFNLPSACGPNPDHAVILVGYDDNNGYWVIKNSWGSGWGEGGYMRLAYGSNIGFEQYYSAWGVDKTYFLNEQTHNFPVGWNLISFAFQPADPDPAVVFDGILISGGLHRYDHTAQGYKTYIDFNPSEFGDIRRGDGYWLYLSEPTTVSYTAYYVNENVEINLPTAGWYLIAGPSRDMLISNVKIRNNLQVLNYPDAVAQGLISSKLYYFENIEDIYNGYRSVGLDPWDENLLKPWYGYWIYTNVDNLVLIMDTSGQGALMISSDFNEENNIENISVLDIPKIKKKK